MKSTKKTADPLSTIYSKVATLTGDKFEYLIKAILTEAGFQNVIKQSAGSQGGFDIRAKLHGVEWRFEAKKTKSKALDEKELATKFDQIERDPGATEYFIIVTNTNISNNLRGSIKEHRNKWYIDLDYWSLCNDKFRKILLSYPAAVIKQLKLTSKDTHLFLHDSQQYLKHCKPFLEEEIVSLQKTSNRFALLQNAAAVISERQELNIRPITEFAKLIERKTPNDKFEKFKHDTGYSCFVLLAKEQMGKSSLMRLWANSVKGNNIVLFFTADIICSGNWMKVLQDRVFSEIERISSSKQSPEYLSTVFDGIQRRLKARNAFIYMFVDALNTTAYEDVKTFFMSEDFMRSINSWRINWVFSCREPIWKEWKEHIIVPIEPFEYTLKEFDDEELESALSTHKISIEKLPFWLKSKLKQPGLLRLCEKMLMEKPDIFYGMPEMTLAEISLMFIRERLDEFSALYPGGEPLSIKGVEHMVNDILGLFAERGYQTLPFKSIREKKDLNPYKLSVNSWNILLQQGFINKNQESYELGNDWGAILIGKYLIDTCSRNDVEESQIKTLLDQIFDGIAPITVENRVSLEDSDKFIDILWFAFHYGKIRGITESLYRMIIDRIYGGQNLAHEQLSEVAATLFPEYSVRYLAGVSSAHHGVALYMREGLEKARSADVIPGVIKLFHDSSDEIKMQMTILLEHFKDARFLPEIYSLIDQADSATMSHQIEHKFDRIFGTYPDECVQLIQELVETGKINNPDYAIGLLGWNGSTGEHAELLKRLIKQQPVMTATALRAMGRLRMPEVENVAMETLERGADAAMQSAAIEALGYIGSKRFLAWCQAQSDIWNNNYYFSVIRSLQDFKSAEAYDFIITSELRQKKWIPFIFFYPQNRHRQLTERQMSIFVEGILDRIQSSSDMNVIWRGLRNLSSLGLKEHKSFWQKYQGTNVPKVIACLARSCAKPEYFDSRGQTLASAAMKEALKILDWIEDREVFVPLLAYLMEADIPRLFAWTLFRYVIKYADDSYKDILKKFAKHDAQHDSTETDIYEQVQNKAIICLTHLEGDDVAEVILKYRPNWVSENDWKYTNSLKHFKTESFVRKVIEVFEQKNEKYFWSAYCFLWEFLPDDVIEPTLQWLKDVGEKVSIHEYMLKLLGRFDRPECNRQIIEYLNNSSTQHAAMEAVLHSHDPQVHAWFKEKIKKHGLSSIIIATQADQEEHGLLLQWIEYHSFKESKPYIQKWLETKEILWLTAEGLITVVYELIQRFESWDMLEAVKKKYYRTNPSWHTAIVKSTLKLVFNKEPIWAWNEFLKYWENSPSLHRKNAVKWIKFMPSKDALEWLIGTYYQTGSFFSDEKEIRGSIMKLISIFPDNLLQQGIELLKVKAKSRRTIDRIFSAQCCGLFGKIVYRQFDFLSDDGCWRVRYAYQYAEISEISRSNERVGE